MIILGIDPGYGRVGYGILKCSNNKYQVIEYGCITTEANSYFPERLNKISKDLKEICSRYNINACSIEKLYFNTNTKTALKVSEARGVILNTIYEQGIDIYEYTPLQIKQALVGYGKADKLQIKSMVKNFLKLSSMPKLDDTTDALAIAICHSHSNKLSKIKNLYN